MVFDFLKKKSNLEILNEYNNRIDPVITPRDHAEAQERYKQQIAEAEARLNVPDTKPTPKDTQPVQATNTPSPADIGPKTEVQETEAVHTEKKLYNIAKDTALIRLHNDLVNKIKQQKGSKTFNEFLTEKLGL